MDTQVLIVGAGPTGLTLAGELARRRVDCVLIDSLEGPQGWDRATIVHPRTMELLATIGLANRMLEVGLQQRFINLYSEGEHLGEMDLAGSGSPFGFNLDVSEEVTESVLAEHLAAQGGSVERGSRLTGLRQLPDRVIATIERDGEERELSAEWIVGCGGLHSPVRELSGIGFTGHDIPQEWAVFDVRLEGWPFDRAATHAILDKDSVILTPLPGDRYRAYVRPTGPESDLVADAALVLERYAPGVELVDVENPTRFHCHTKVADRYREGRALIAGDAAHVCSPSEGHGMNTGIQDAFNLAWKLALVCDGEADERLLDSYEAERRPVALAITASGDEFEAMQTLAEDAERAERDAALRETFAGEATRHEAILAETELNYSYRGSQIVSGDFDGISAGDRLPAEPVLGDGTSLNLHDSFQGSGHTLLVIGPDLDELPRVLDGIGMDAAGLIPFTLGLGIAEPTDRGHIHLETADRLGIRGITFLAVRPDLHVGLRADGGDPAPVLEYLELIRSGGATPGAAEAK